MAGARPEREVGGENNNNVSYLTHHTRAIACAAVFSDARNLLKESAKIKQRAFEAKCASPPPTARAASA